MARKPVTWSFGINPNGVRNGAGQIRRELKSVEQSAADTASKFKGAYVAVAAAIGTVIGASAKLVSVTREFEKLHAQLITATGSAKNADIAFSALQQFASQTPYDLQQVTEGFTKLVNLGLTPSAAALRSYGDTASAMGKDLNQLIEAVADAATGEFERLKEFGIKAKSQGDQVSFTFRGMTTTVAKNANDIEQYLIQLGQNNFAGAMAQRMDTLDGALSNLGDSWDLLFNAISQQGVGDLIQDGVRLAIEVIDDLTSLISSGQLVGYIEALGSKFSGLGQSAQESFAIISDATSDWHDEMAATAYAGQETLNFLGDAFLNFPENAHAATQLLTVELAAMVDQFIAYGDAAAQVFGIKLGELVQTAGSYGAEIVDALNPFSDENVDYSAQRDAFAQAADEMVDEAFQAADGIGVAARSARETSIHEIMAQREAALKSFDDQIKAADEARAKFEENRAAMASEGGDPLAGFGIGKPAANDDPADAEQEKRIEKLLGKYQTEQQLEAEHQQALADIKQAFTDGDIASRQDYDQIMLQMEQQYGDKVKSLRQKTLTDLQRFNQSSFQAQAKTVFGELANITAGVARENRAMFEINKVAGIANAIISAHEGISKTLASYPYPLNIGMAAAHATAAFAQVNAIKSQSFGSGGAAPSLAGGTAAPPVSPVGGGAVASNDSGGPVFNIALHGENFSRSQVQGMLEQIGQELQNGMQIPGFRIVA